MDLKEVRSLLALAEVGSISLAAQRLHLSAPAIHKQLKTLEADLGTSLYEKIGRSLQLTQAAEVLIPYLQDMLTHETWAGAHRHRSHQLHNPKDPQTAETIPSWY